MSKKIFIGSISYETTEEELAALFRTCGTVIHANIPADQATRRSKGVGFVEMSTDAEARTAIAKLSGSILGGRKIFASEAKPQAKRPGGFVGKPDFVERRSGKDRRQARGASGGGGMKRSERPTSHESRREGSFERKKRWAGKAGFPAKKKWKKRPASDSDPKDTWNRKPGAGGDTRKWAGGKRKWSPKPGRSGGKKPWRLQPEGRFGKKEGSLPKKWERKPGGSGGRKPWGRKPDDRFIKFKEKKENFRQGKWEPKPEGSGEKRPRAPKPTDPFQKFKRKKSFAPRKYVSKPGGFGPKKRGGKPGGRP